jgi:hypothetical protein
MSEGKEHNDGQEPIEKAVERLEQAEANLSRVRGEEAQAEHEVAEAIEDLEEAERHDYTIIVNGRPKVVRQKKQTYRDIARLAYPDADFNNYLYTITYFNGEGGREGDLVEGETIKVKNEMVFNVRRSDKS